MSIVAALGIFLLLVILFRYVALGSIIAAASLPVMALLLGETQTSIAVVLVAAACLLIIVKHHQNIRRIATGTEPRFSWKRR
jgi:glycerol-3-phosphate acyltransferase PlsY